MNGYRAPSVKVQIGECHGTGTALGDPIEIGAMKSVQHDGCNGVRGDQVSKSTSCA